MDTNNINIYLYDYFGAHFNQNGVLFRVYAPNAKSVSVVGDFNNYDRNIHTMNNIGNGIYELLISNAREYDTYKYSIETKNNNIIEKADPFAFYSELRPNNASRIYKLHNYEFNDFYWINNFYNLDEKPLNIYEVHLGTWMQRYGNYISYNEIAPILIDYVKKHNFNCIEFLPLSEHPFDGSWGYQSNGFFSPTSRFGTPNDLKYLIDLAHQNDIAVILDIVPGHFVKDEHGLIMFDGMPLYEYKDKNLMYNEWGSVSFDLSDNYVRSYLISNALYWLKEFHFDGLRIDAVANMIYYNGDGHNKNQGAIEFIKILNNKIHEQFPNKIMIAEDSTAYPGVTKAVEEDGLGFNYKWNMGWMNDTLKYIEEEHFNRKFHHNKITFSMMYNYSEKFLLPLSHDEVVHGKKSLLEKQPGNQFEKFAGLRLLLGYQMTHPGKKLLFMGCEFGQYIEWRDDRELDWFLLQYPYHDSMQKYVKDINEIYLNYPELYELDFDSYGFKWIDSNNANQSILSFIRRSKNGGEMVVVCNFSNEEYHDYLIGVEKAGLYFEIFNSDNGIYSGNGLLNPGELFTYEQYTNDCNFSLKINIPKLSILIFKIN